MGLYINSNQSAMSSINYMNRTTQSMSVSFERLSSGLRINSAKDDAAGLSISSRLTAQIRGINQAVRNGGEGISLAQTAEGALNETTSILQRIRELAVQSANNTNNTSDRESLQSEVDQLKQELDRIAEVTNLNGNNLLDGTFLAQNLQIGAQANEGMFVSIGGATSKDLGRQARYDSSTFVNGTAINSTTNNLRISNELGDFDIRATVSADDQVSSTLGEISAIAKANAINASSAQSGVRAIVGKTTMTADSNVNGEIKGMTLDQDLYFSINGVAISGFTIEENDATGSLVAGINAESDRTGVVASLTEDSRLSLEAADGRNIDLKFEESSFGTWAFTYNNLGFASVSPAAGNTFDNPIMTGEITLQSDESFVITAADASVIGFAQTGRYGVNSDNSVKFLDISTQEGAVKAMDTIDLALEQTSSIRSMLGALQNRLESTINNITVTKENLSASRTRIMDADFAQETADLSRNQIIQQASISVLAQAIQQPQSVLSLLNA